MRFSSENIGGVLSFTGSIIPIVSGDIHSIAAAIAFAVAEVTFMFKGHTHAGYSIGALAFAAGDIVLASSDAVASNPALRTALLLMGAAWAVGILRAPLHKLAMVEGLSPTFHRVAGDVSRLIQPTVGASCLALRLPGLVTAAMGGNYLIATAITLWGASDVLCGRLQSYVKALVSKIGL